MLALRIALVAAFLCSRSHVRASEPTAEQIEFFEKKVRPVLVEQCGNCHSADAPKLKGGLRVDSRAALLAGGENGPAIVPGRPEKSRLIEAIGYKNVDLQMPPKAKLPDAAIADLTAWVKMGAPWPGMPEATVAGKQAFDIDKRKASHWAWKPIQAPRMPSVKDASWPLAPTDRFLLARLEEKGIAPAKPAAPSALLRRLYFDLIGLPPAPGEIAAFTKDYAINPQTAVETVVDRLLASPQFGECWARHWLDLVRYAESRGHEFEPNIPNAWQYRDYVIRAFNADVPYNRFVMEHVAGDLLPEPRLHPRDGFNESILGTGFWFLGEEVHSPVDIRGDEADRYDNRIDVLTKTFLGLTVSCARCHDHKFDAISTRDYYALYGFLRSSNYRLVRFDAPEENKRIAADLEALRGKQRRVLLKAYAEGLSPGVASLSSYLTAAGEVMARGMGDAAVERAAADRKLDPKRLSAWLAHLQKARKDPADPFHAWARFISEPDGRTRLLASWREQLRKAKEGFKGLQIVVDYADARTDWLPDDVSFGTRPLRPGDVRFSNDAARPIDKIVDYAAAEFDPAWSNIKVAAGSQLDPGALGYNRAGKTIRTPTFPLEAGKLFYRVKGTGRAYASVDGHVVIAGPLHGALVRPINTGGKWQWFVHDLSAYQGHRIHVELTAESADFAVAMVAQGDAPPPILDAPPGWYIRAFENDNTAEALATAYQTQFQKAINCLNEDTLSADKEPGDVARVADWLIHQPHLLGFDESSLRKIAQAFIDEEAKLRANIRSESRLALAMQDGSPENEHVFIRGSHKAPSGMVPRRLLEALAGAKGIESKGSGRLELARQMADPKINPFITRVIVNRVWHHLFGRGIVASTDNFGFLGERPTHPELLDYLAVQFAKGGWSIKKLIRQLVLSRAYQMSSQPDEKADAADPENLLLHRARLRRLQGEAIRDTLLLVSGRMNATMYGPSVPIHLTPFLDGRGRPASGPLDGDGRSSIYLAVRRNFLSPMMLAFDTPSPFSTVGRRTISNVPAQALILMNDPFVHQMAELWGKKLAESPGDAREKIERMYLQAFARSPTEAELNDCLAYLEGSGKPQNDPKTWGSLAHVLINVKEFIFVK